MVFPVVLGHGKRLFGDVGQPRAMKVVEAKQTADVVTLRLGRG